MKKKTKTFNCLLLLLLCQQTMSSHIFASFRRRFSPCVLRRGHIIGVKNISMAEKINVFILNEDLMITIKYFFYYIK